MSEAIAALVPHSGNMMLLDKIISWDEEQVTTQVIVKNNGLFNQEDGSYPAYLGIELMAQSIAAYAGMRAKQAGLPVELGFLLGTRRFETNVDRFPLNSILTITAKRSLEDESGMGVFECWLTAQAISQTARLNVYRPTNVQQYFAEEQP
ncbi:hotdog family protein [Pseudomonas sp. F1_0610]|uniref:hotdog family protein n=1 Tax=Pseudomonas sp. F1_0610 TaxID=3114284 RepID=UPI0039C396EF